MTLAPQLAAPALEFTASTKNEPRGATPRQHNPWHANN
jgi:hypothetical protein